MSRGRRRAALVVATLAVLVPIACGDGTPAFCTSLAEVSDLDALAGALEEDDLRTALAEARRLRDLAAEAPPELRADFRALAEAVVDIVGLLEDERAASDGTGGGSPGPAEVERRREQLNDRLGQLDRRSLRVATWSSRECGLDLT